MPEKQQRNGPPTISCPLCGGLLINAVSTCPHCYKEIFTICPGCKQYVPSTLATCNFCGTPLVSMGELARRRREETAQIAPVVPEGLEGMELQNFGKKKKSKQPQTSLVKPDSLENLSNPPGGPPPVHTISQPYYDAKTGQWVVPIASAYADQPYYDAKTGQWVLPASPPAEVVAEPFGVPSASSESPSTGLAAQTGQKELPAPQAITWDKASTSDSTRTTDSISGKETVQLPPTGPVSGGGFVFDPIAPWPPKPAGEEKNSPPKPKEEQ